MFADNIFWVTHIVICVYCVSVSNCDTRTRNRCIELLSRTFTVQLQCSAGEWIHVEQEAYGDGDAATCRLKYDASCSKVHNSSQNGLIANCNGKQSCREVVSASTLTCNVTDAAAEINYTCIKGSLDMCSSGTDRTAVNGSVYLHSPGFPGSVGVNSSCVVRITGQNIRVTLVEERMTIGLLNISGDGKQLWTSVDVDQYNRVLPETAAEVEIVYTNHDQNGSNVWIRVDDESTTTEEATVDSTTNETSASTSPPSATGHVNETSRAQSSPVTASFPTDASASKSTPWPSKSSTISASVDLIVAACAASGGVLTVVVITIVLCRRKQRRHALPDNSSAHIHFQLNASESTAPTNTYFGQFLTSTTGSTEKVQDTGTTSKQADTRPEHDLYSKGLPRSSRFKRGDNKECEKNTEMMDTCLNSPSKKELIDERTDDASNENTDTCFVDCGKVEAAACDMTENDIYCSGPATHETPANGSLECGDMPKEKCCMVENDIYVS